MYKVGDKVVCPTHGAGVIDRIEKINVMGDIKDYFVICLFNADMEIKIPVSENPTGIRNTVSCDYAKDIIESFVDLSIEDISTNWSKRYRENIDRIKSGDITEISKVLKCLMLRSKENNLSAGERKMLQSTKNIVISELAMVLELDAESIENALMESL